MPGASRGLADAEDAVAMTEEEHSSVRFKAVELCRRWVDARANQLTPHIFAEQIASLGRESGLDVVIYDEDALVEMGCGAMLSVGAGSTAPSCLVEVRYAGDPKLPHLALVGKGVTFDSGGLSAKSADAMVGMHTDMAGAAAVVAAMGALRDLGVRQGVRAWLPLAENLPGPGATRPGDVVTSLSGRRIEVVDTDFEGRVLMADALTLASRSAPVALLDVATLTYQAGIALGLEIGAVLARDRALGRAVERAGRVVGEEWWQLPLASRYRRCIASTAPGADLRNHPGNDHGRAITAGLFLGEFVPEDIPWVHLDIAGPATVGRGPDTRATGFSTLTLIHLISTFDQLEVRPTLAGSSESDGP